MVVLLLANALFLFLHWNGRRASTTHADHTTIAYQNEIAAILSSLYGRPLAIDILVSKGHCSSCIDQGLPFWLTLFGKLPTRILYRSSSSSPRDGDRFARQIGIPDSGVVLVNDVPSTDSLLWSGTAPSVVVRDVQNGTRYLVHIGHAANRERTSAFYTALTDQVHRRDSSRGPLSPGLVH